MSRDLPNRSLQTDRQQRSEKVSENRQEEGGERTKGSIEIVRTTTEREKNEQRPYEQISGDRRTCLSDKRVFENRWGEMRYRTYEGVYRQSKKDKERQEANTDLLTIERCSL